MSNFKYRPLNPDRKEIRLLVFEPDSGAKQEDNAALRCIVRHVSLLDEPKVSYYTVSYCWGLDPPSDKITLNGEEAWVPSSAIGALRTVCHPVYGKRDLAVWIDAICINQADDVEKSQQVAMMKDVYATAAQVLIWLGDEGPTTALGFEAINAVLDANSNGVNVDYEFFSDRADWVNLVNVFDSPYFGRLWPVQEICLSKSAICWRGKCCVGW